MLFLQDLITTPKGVHLYNRTGDDVTHTQEEGEGEEGGNNNNSKITKWYIYMYESV